MNSWVRHFGIMISLVLAFTLGLFSDGTYFFVPLLMFLVFITNQGITYLAKNTKKHKNNAIK